VHPTQQHCIFFFVCEKAACGEDCEAARGEGDKATKEGLKPPRVASSQ